MELRLSCTDPSIWPSTISVPLSGNGPLPGPMVTNIYDVWALFQYKACRFWYGDSYYNNKTVVGLSNLCNGNSYTVKMSLYRNRAQETTMSDSSVQYTIVGSNNGFWFVQCQVITNAGVFLIGPLGVNFSVKFQSKYNNFHTRKWIWICHLQNISHCVPSSV